MNMYSIQEKLKLNNSNWWFRTAAYIGSSTKNNTFVEKCQDKAILSISGLQTVEG